MQHYKHAVFKRFYPDPDTNFLKIFFSANIKTLFTYPKTIWYSMRYNSGEKFLLYNPLLYPYGYEFAISIEEENDPVRSSTKMLSAINELEAVRYMDNAGIIKTKLSSKKSYMDALGDNLETSFKQLHDIVRLNPECDLPVAVYARILYASAKINNSKETFRGVSAQKIDNETLRNVLEKFIQKLDYADAASISQVLYTLNTFKYYNNSTWKTLIKSLDERHFESEFTKVTNKAPFIFRYKDIPQSSFKVKGMDKLGNSLHLLGYKPIFEAYYAISQAQNNKVNSEEYLKTMGDKFQILREEYENYTKHI